MELHTTNYPKVAKIWCILILLLLSSISCLPKNTAFNHAAGRAFEEAEELFRQEPRWLGADGALSIPLDDNRTLWLFGDTFIATTPTCRRSESEMVKNTIAIQTGKDVRTASITFHWRQDDDGSPASFFPENGQFWYWPGHGIRLDEGSLIIFLYKIVATPDEGLGFANAGCAIAIIDNPDVSADFWNPRIIDIAPSSFDAVPATAVVRDGSYIVAVAISQEGTHAGALVRYPVDQIAQGNLNGAQWWAGDERGWVIESSLGPEGPTLVIDDAGSECSLHWDQRSESFVHIASYGFGTSTIGLRTAPALTGPWSSPQVVYRPPESDSSEPFVYAAKAHPELTGSDTGDLVVTYATNSFDFRDLFTEQGEKVLYWPRFVLVSVGK